MERLSTAVTIESLPVGATFHFRFMQDSPFIKISQYRIYNVNMRVETVLTAALDKTLVFPKRSWFKEFLERL